MALIQNKKFNLNFEAQDSFEAGIELYGYEVKSLRSKLGSLDGSYVIIRGNEAFLVNAYIPPFQPANTPEDYDPYRNRRLLLHKNELAELAEAEKEKRLTIVPKSVYNSHGKIKAEIAIAKGKKEFDKREDIKKRDTERDVERDLKDMEH